MKRLPKSSLLLSKLKIVLIKPTKHLMLFGGLFFCLFSKAQIVNYVNDGGFEILNSYSLTTYYNVTKYWQPIDTGKSSNYLATLLAPIKNAPGALGYQFPRHGKNYIVSTFFCSTCPTYNRREYPRNRLKQTLIAGKTYCAKFYIVNTNNSPLAIDRYGMYFADSSLDTINYCNNALNYLNPQIQNPIGNIITDTMNWIPITGTFVATGNEKYLVLGNFFTEVNTNTLLINPTYASMKANDVCIDDVSVIDINLPAYAGRDTFFIPGDSIYLGRPSDVGIDEDCMWYKLPNTTTAIDTVAGLWVKPVTTTTYVVKQDICGVIKWDTVVLYQSAIGVHELDLISNNLKIYPQPATSEVNIQLNLQMNEPFTTYQLYNNLGQVIREEELSFKNYVATIKVADLAEGVYSLRLLNTINETVTKKLVIAK